MYQPPAFREDRLDVQHDLIRAHPLGLLITAGPAGLLANPFPFLLDAEASENGTLRLHVARANPQWQEFEAIEECLVVFQGPHDHVTPSWYATKRETGKVVPTWNYATVHAYGRAQAIEDRAWLARHVAELTDQQEHGQHAPWATSDAPATYIDAMLRGIVGIRVEVNRLEGKWKMSQNRAAADAAGTASGLRARASGDDIEVADLVDRFARTR
jgi:transcriptional regulator